MQIHGLAMYMSIQIICNDQHVYQKGYLFALAMYALLKATVTLVLSSGSCRR